MPGTTHGPGARERLVRAHDELPATSAWRGALATAVRAVDEPGADRVRTLFWLHDALGGLLPADARQDTLEQRSLRRAATAIEDELVAEHASALLAA
jgi:hypothetical protein